MGNIPARVNVEGKTVVFVPFAVDIPEINQSKDYFESVDGREIANIMASHVAREVSDAKVSIPSQSLESEITNKFSDPDWKKISETEKLDLIVLGTIKHWQTRDKGSANVFQGRAVVNLKVIGKNNHLEH